MAITDAFFIVDRYTQKGNVFILSFLSLSLMLLERVSRKAMDSFSESDTNRAEPTVSFLGQRSQGRCAFVIRTPRRGSR